MTLAAAEHLLDGRVTLHQGDSRDVLRSLPDASVDSVVTDPPYALVSITKRFGGQNAAPAKSSGATGVYARASAGFMGQQWDTGETAFAVEFWAEVLRVLKPGGHVVAFGGTRTYHRLALAIEDAGFEIRDQLAWAYGTGFPKSHNLPGGLGTALKPAWEPIVLARKPIAGTVAANVATHGTGALNIDGCRVASDDANPSIALRETARRTGKAPGRPGAYGYTIVNRISDERYMAARAAEHLGRWPANLLHDGGDEVVSLFPASKGQQGDVRGTEPSRPGGEGTNCYSEFSGARPPATKRGDDGSAARFFFTAKADSDDRIGSRHPTVKPVNLMRWLVRLVTPRGGLVLDPFAGTGTTGEAAWREGFRAVLVEREAVYCDDIRRRMALCLAGPDEKRREIIKANGGDSREAPLPLFGGGDT